MTTTTTMAGYALWTEGKIVKINERKNNPDGPGVILYGWWRPINSHAGCWAGKVKVLVTDYPKLTPHPEITRWPRAHRYGADDRGGTWYTDEF